MGVYLEVPYSNQLTPAAGGVTFADPTACWLHSASMVLSYFGVPLTDGIPELHVQSMNPAQRAAAQAQLGAGMPAQGHLPIGSPAGNAALAASGFSGNAYQLLATRVGLEQVPGCAMARAFTAAELEQLLRNGGPIAFGWVKTAGTNSYGHFSVMVGLTSDNRVVNYHDPENAPNARMSLAEFNARRRPQASHSGYFFPYSMTRRTGVTPGMVRPLPGRR